MNESEEAHPEVVDPDLEASLRDLIAHSLSSRVRRFESVPAGLGARRFVRVHLDSDSAVDAADSANVATAIARIDAEEDPTVRPAGMLPEPPLEPLRRYLEANGIPVPRCYGADPNAGIELMEDVGDLSLERLASTSDDSERESLYREACRWIPRLQQLRPPDSRQPAIEAFDRKLDADLFDYKAQQFVSWALPHGLQRPATRPESEIVHRAFAQIAQECAAAPQRLAHRDYKAANLHFVDAGGGTRRMVMIDLQGAFLAPPEYDLVCLLRDSHVPLPTGTMKRLAEETRQQLPDLPDAPTFWRRFTLLTLSRVGKDLGRYLYAAHEKRDSRYLAFVPNAISVLAEAATVAAPWHPDYAGVAEFIQKLEQRVDGADDATDVTDLTEPKGRTSEARGRGKLSCAP